jgi:predicted nucleic acid-binding protein
VSALILYEYIRVLAYPKFTLGSVEIRALLDDKLLPFIETVNTSSLAVPELRDKDDAKFVACAKTAGARWLVSGDDDLLTLRRVAAVEIVSVATFLQHLKQRSRMSPGPQVLDDGMPAGVRVITEPHNRSGPGDYLLVRIKPAIPVAIRGPNKRNKS